jgi:hypothetical protein
MYSDSRKAQRNSFAHHRAQLIFAPHRAHAGDAVEWAATVHEGTEHAPANLSRREQVVAGLFGFTPADPAGAHA